MAILILCLLFCFLPPPLYPTPVLNKGQCVTKYYRWMQKNGGYIWIQSSATIAINAKNANEKNIIWVNYLLRYLTCFVSLSVINCAHCLTAETSRVPSFPGMWAVCSSPKIQKSGRRSKPRESWVASLWGALEKLASIPGPCPTQERCLQLQSRQEASP